MGTVYEILLNISSANWFSAVLFLTVIFLLRWVDGFYSNFKMLLTGNTKYSNIPGPQGLPYIGSAFRIDKKKPYETFRMWAQEFGKVYHVKIFGKNIVVLNSSEAIHEALIERGHDFAGRPKLYYRSRIMSDGSQDIVSASPSPSWHALRKTVQREIKKYDPGFQRLEKLTNLIIDDLLEDFKSFEGKAHDPREAVTTAILNITLLFMIGDKLHKNDPQLMKSKKLIEVVTKVMNVGGKGAELDFFPWLRYFGNATYKEIMEAKQLRNEIYDWMSKKIEYDIKNNTEIDGVVHGFHHLLKMGKENLTTTNVKLAMVNLLIGSTSSTQSYLYLFCNLMVHYPDVQQQLYEEIQLVFGKICRPSLADQEEMPFTKATIAEILRFGSLSPILIPHCTTVDTSVCDYKIPANTTVFMNSRFVHHDPNMWHDPYKFDPSRFLLKNNENKMMFDYAREKYLLSFGGGPRACPGKALARSRLFLAITNIIQSYLVEPDESQPLSPCDPRTYELGLVLSPQPFKVKFLPRH